ncbi:MAG: inositol monophosphatase family protein [Bacteroidota bacterium]
MLKKIIDISKEAGEIIREGFGKKLTLEFKSTATDFVTNIDKAAEQKIIEFIHKEYPTHNILAEESGKSNGNSDYTWVVDPLDGTMNFAHGLPIFSVSIGVMKKDEIIAGVIYDVMNDVIYSSEKGSGAYQNDRKIAVSDVNQLNKSLLVTGFPYNISENPKNAFEKFTSFLKEARGVRRLGSAAIDCCYIAAGAFDGFWEVTLNAWDICAGQLLIEEAGGKVTTFNDQKIDYANYANIELLATNGKVHQQMMEVLNL